jgi:hypothetical protein
LDFVLHNTHSSVDAAANRIKKILNGRSTQVNKEPESWE